MSIILLKSFKLHLLIYLWICKYISLPKSFPAGQKMSLLHCQVHSQRNFPHSADGCENKLCTHVILHRAAQTVGTRSRTLANNAGLVLVEIVLKWCKFLHKSPIIELPKHFNLQSAWGRLGQTSVSLSWQEADKFQFLCYEKVFWKHIKKKTITSSQSDPGSLSLFACKWPVSHVMTQMTTDTCSVKRKAMGKLHSCHADISLFIRDVVCFSRCYTTLEKRLQMVHMRWYQ